MNWTDYYTSYELSKKIQELKGELREDDPYWESPLTFIWLDEFDRSNLNSYILIKSISPKILQNKNFIPAYHIFQNICCEYSNEFLRENKNYYHIEQNLDSDLALFMLIIARKKGEHDKRAAMKNLEEFLLDHLNPTPFDKGE